MPHDIIEWALVGLAVGVIAHAAQSEDLPVWLWGAVALAISFAAIAFVPYPWTRIVLAGLAAYGLMAAWTVYVRRRR